MCTEWLIDIVGEIALAGVYRDAVIGHKTGIVMLY